MAGTAAVVDTWAGLRIVVAAYHIAAVQDMPAVDIPDSDKQLDTIAAGILLAVHVGLGLLVVHLYT